MAIKEKTYKENTMNVPPSINKYNKEMLINGKQVRKRNYFPRNENYYSIILPPPQGGACAE